MLMREQLDDAVTRAELTVALETTVRDGLEGSQCLCHGAFGNLDALLLARALPAAKNEVRASESLVKRLLAEVAEHGPRCANPAGIESPGLMTGVAGDRLRPAAARSTREGAVDPGARATGHVADGQGHDACTDFDSRQVSCAQRPPRRLAHTVEVTVMTEPPRTIFRPAAVDRYINGAQGVEKPVAPTRVPRVTMLYVAIAGCISVGALMVALLLGATQP